MKDKLKLEKAKTALEYLEETLKEMETDVAIDAFKKVIRIIKCAECL